jgi:PiT family inorganic phosphate transporter
VILELGPLGIPVILWIAGVLAVYMAWAIGANDVANAMGTSVGSGALTIRNAVIVAAIFEFSGALFVGGHVTDTVRKGMLDMELVQAEPLLLLYGMLGALAAAATLLVVATKYGLPVSTSHSVVGAIVGFGAFALGIDAVNWGKVAQIAVSWVTSPLIGGVIAFLVFHVIRYSILDREDPMESAKRAGPFFFFLVFFIVGLVTLFKGLKHLKLDLELPEALMYSIGLGIIGALVGRFFVDRVKRAAPGSKETRFLGVERVFVVLQILTACALAFAHGSNDVANSIGPLAAINGVLSGTDLAQQQPIELWMLLVGGVGIVFGLATWGYRVMETVGRKITELTPSRGFAATLASAITVVLASRLGIPVSTTHILVGSVLGVGLARGIGAIDLRVVGRIVVSWIATLPIAAALSIFFFFVFKTLLS